MIDESPDEHDRSLHEQRAFAEAAERERRLKAWLGGVLSGGPLPVDGQKEWRQGLAMYDRSEQYSAENTEELPANTPEGIGDTLLKCRHRIRVRREFTGAPPLEIDEEERERRSARVIESILTDRAAGSEPTPLHLVLAARYIEGEIDFERYNNALQDA